MAICDDVVAFARDRGIEVVAGHELGAPPASHDDPRVDFGRLACVTPLAVVRPRDRDELAACVTFFAANHVRHKVRGAGHGSGGQVLIDDGVVVDLRYLARIVADDPAAQTITIEGGCWWLDVVRHLYPQGRRPRSVTANLRATVAGTLSVGGFGDSSHVTGLQIAHVTRMTAMTPDGALHVLTRDDELFRWTLAGRGQLAIIVDATIETVARPWRLAARTLRWRNLAEFLADAPALASYQLVRARLHWKPRNPEPQLSAIVGSSEDAPPSCAHAASTSSPAPLDLYELLTAAPPASWRDACPALELALPLPHALSTWPALAAQIAAARIPELQPEGSAVMIVPCDPRFPLAPLPGSDRCMMIALRPELPTPAEARALVPALAQIGAAALAAGGRMYLMSIELDTPDFLARQFGDALARFQQLKHELDPHGLLNPWRL